MTVDVNLSQTLNTLIKSRFSNEVSDSVQRLISGLKINDTSDDIGGQIISSRLGSISSSLSQGIENGNSGIALIQTSNKALDNQLDILDLIKEKLVSTQDGNTSAEGIEAIRVDITSLLNTFNEIASNTNYNNTYTLQKSNSNNDSSTSIQITLTSETKKSIDTPSIRSNSEGLALDSLKNLSVGELSETVAKQYEDIVDTAIETIKSYSDSFNSSQNEISISIENLTGIEKTTSLSKQSIQNTNINEENAILNKFKLLEKASQFAIVQANLTQATALRLLSEPISIVDNQDSNTNNKEVNSLFDNYSNSKDFTNYSPSIYQDKKNDNSFSTVSYAQDSDLLT